MIFPTVTRFSTLPVSAVPRVLTPQQQNADDDGHAQHWSALAGDAEEELRDRRDVGVHELPEVAPEAERIERTRDDVREPQQPPGREPRRSGEGLDHIRVPAAGARVCRGQFGVGEGGEQGDESVEEEGEQRARPGFARGNSGEHEDTGADHGADADHARVEETEVARKRDILGGVGVLVLVGHRAMLPHRARSGHCETRRLGAGRRMKP